VSRSDAVDVELGGSSAGNGSAAAPDDAPNRCGRANGKKSDDEAYMAASADSRELSSDGQSDFTAVVDVPAPCSRRSADDVLESESRRPVDRHGDESTSRFNLASFFVFCTGVDVLERRAAGVEEGEA